jgi:ABC-type amino acid transport substrate-binding protein
LIKVEPGYYYLTTGAFAKEDKGITITSKADLKKYKVGIVRGIAHAEAATEGMTDVQVVATYDQLYQMVDAGRIDVAIDEGINGPGTIKNLGLKGIKQVGEIARLDLFHMLNPAKKDLAPKISAAIKAMKDSGELAKLIKQYEAEATK